MYSFKNKVIILEVCVITGIFMENIIADHSHDGSDHSSLDWNPRVTLLQVIPIIQEPKMICELFKLHRQFLILYFAVKRLPFLQWILIVTAVFAGYMLGQLSSELESAEPEPDSKLQQKCSGHISNIEIDASSVLPNSQLEHFIDRKIRKAIDLYEADKLGQIDYALESNGGYILSIFDTKSYSSKLKFDLFGILTIEPSSNPAVILKPGTMPGECYAFSGQRGKFLIRLSIPTEITAVTLEHASISTLIDPRSAPRQFGVSEDQKTKEFLGFFTFDIYSEETLKTFPIKTTSLPLKLRLSIYHNVELHIVNNHGHPDYTCLYRFRVHGKRIHPH